MVGVDVFECRAAEFAAKRGILYELPERLAPACRVAGQEPVLPMLDHAGEVASSACHCGHDDERGFKVLHAALTLAERVVRQRGEIDVGLYLKLCERLPRPPGDRSILAAKRLKRASSSRRPTATNRTWG